MEKDSERDFQRLSSGSVSRIVRFYHTFGESIPDDGVTWIWIPLNADISLNVRYISEHMPEITAIQVEDVFAPFITEQISAHVQLFHLPVGRTERNKKLVLYAQSDTLADSSAKMYAALRAAGADVTLMVPTVGDEGAVDFFTRHNLPFVVFSSAALRSLGPDLFVVLNDWTKEVHRIFAFCRWWKIPTVCVQESIIDFGDKMLRMQYADEVIIQGIHTVKELRRNRYYVTGNPRYAIDRDNRRGSYALINSNFTYGIFEHLREEWLSDVCTTLSESGIPFKISQHPRDNGELSRFGEVIASNSAVLPQAIRQSNMVITRFSSLVHEALAFNIPVVYYNPHHEEMQYDFECNGRFLWYAETPDKLSEAVNYLFSHVFDHSEIADYLAVHCIPRAGNSKSNIAEAIAGMHPRASSFGMRDVLNLVIYFPPVLQLLKKLKRTFVR